MSLFALIVILFSAFVLFGLVATVFGLPGNWLIVLVSATAALFSPIAHSFSIHWATVAVLFVLALLAELIETVAGAAGLKKGGSRIGAVAAIVGSFAGGLIGAMVGIPIPVFGPVIGLILFSGLGAMLGAYLGERATGKDNIKASEIGKAAFMGRMVGSLSKIILGGVMAAVAFAAAILK